MINTFFYGKLHTSKKGHQNYECSYAVLWLSKPMSICLRKKNEVGFNNTLRYEVLNHVFALPGKNAVKISRAGFADAKLRTDHFIIRKYREDPWKKVHRSLHDSAKRLVVLMACRQFSVFRVFFFPPCQIYTSTNLSYISPQDK